MRLLTKKIYLKPFVLIVIICLITLWPSFKLALTGDDLLGLWRLNQKIGINAGIDARIKYFFSDYGPQDTLTYLIHKFFGFDHFVYFFIAFFLRICASLSFIPLVLYITKNKTAAFLSALFFSITTTGLEVNNWSFNMPSFISITFLNFHIFFLIKIAENNSFKNNFLSIIFFIATIIAQPIRAAFLPVFSIVTIFILFIKNKYFFKKYLIHLLLLLLCFYLIIVFSEIGAHFGIVLNQSDRIHLHWFDPEKKTFNILLNSLSAKNYSPFLYLIAQLGQIILPFSVLPQNLEVINNFNELIFISLIFYLGYCLMQITISKQINETKLSNFFIKIGTFWTLLPISFFIKDYSYPIATLIYGGILLGGYFIIFIFYLLISQKYKFLNLYLIAFLFLTTISYFAFWLKNPFTVQTTVNRYLIIPAAGFSLLLAIIFSKLRSSSFVYLLFSLLLLINIRETYKYLNHLSIVRKAKLADKIRSSIPYNPKIKDNEFVLYYLEADNPDILYHTLYFGFPFFIHYNQGLTNPWNIGYVTDWKEVISAYTDGSSLKKFKSEDIKPMNLDNIFSLKIESGELRNTTSETRNRLKSLR